MRLKGDDRKCLVRGQAPEDVEVARTEGAYVIDGQGRRYIDFTSGWCVGNVGWGQDEIREAVQRSRSPEYVNPNYLYRPWVELGKTLARIAPGKLAKTVRATGGTEAVEIAFQIARLATKREKILAVEGSYHGNSIAVRAVAEAGRIKTPLDARAAEAVERRLRRRDVAAVILEPILLNRGVLAPDLEFMERLAASCGKHGTLLILDEVATGFGRTGTLFAAERFGAEPDLLCLAKGITGGYAPLGATMITDKVARAIEGKFSFYSTYGWHPYSVDAALANLRWLLKRRDALLRNVAERSAYARARLSRMKFRDPCSIRVEGLAIGVEFAEDFDAGKLSDKCRKAGLLVSADKNLLWIFPPLTIDSETCRKGFDLLQSVVTARGRAAA